MDMQAISAEFQKIKTIRTVQLGMSIAAVVLAAIGITRPVGFCIGILTVCVYLFWGRRVMRQYCEKVLEVNICQGLGSGMEHPRTTGSGSMTEDFFDDLQMFPRHSSKGENILSRNGFSFGYKGREVCGSEVTWHYGVGEDKRSFHFISGTMLWCDGGEGDWLLLRREWLHPKAMNAFLDASGYHEVVAREELEADYLLFSHDADAQPTPELERSILKLLKKVSNLAGLRLSSQGNALFLLNRFYAGKVSANALPTERELTRNPLEERDDLLKILCAN